MSPKRTAGSIRRLPSGKYQARIRDGVTNERVSLGSFTTKADANAAIAAASTDQARGAWVNPNKGRVSGSSGFSGVRSTRLAQESARWLVLESTKALQF